MGAAFTTHDHASQHVHRVYSISDLHTDHAENLDVVTSWRDSLELYSKNDCLIVAGDISQHLSVLEETLGILLAVFGEVFFVPGNNELRLSKPREASDSAPAASAAAAGNRNLNSITKFGEVLRVCQRLGVHTQPRDVFDKRVRVIPLFGWYTPFFEPSFSGDSSYTRGWLDFRRVRWPRSFRVACKGETFGDSKVLITPEHVAAGYFAKRNAENLKKCLCKQYRRGCEGVQRRRA